MKKAQSISINTIVVAAIALIVLVIIIAIFSGRIKIFSAEARSCTSQGGQCAAACDVPFETNIPGTDCSDRETDINCCVRLFEPNDEDSNS